MTVKDLERLYDYGYWANRRLFRVVAALTPEEFTRDVAGSYGSIRNTLVHALSAEWGWLDRCGGRERPGGRLKPEDFPTPESLVEAWNRVEGYVREFLAGIEDSDLTRRIDFTIPTGDSGTGELGALMHHAALHGIHHRGQAAVLLRSLGHAPGNFDLLFYDAG